MSRDASKKAQMRYEEKISRVHWAINPESEPTTYQAFEDLVQKHGGRSTKGSIAAALKEAVLSTTSTVPIDAGTPVYDVSNSTVVGIRLPSAILNDIVQSAGRNEITIEQEILNRLGFTLETHKTIL